VALYVRDCLDSIELDNCDDNVECLMGKDEWESQQGRHPARCLL